MNIITGYHGGRGGGGLYASHLPYRYAKVVVVVDVVVIISERFFKSVPKYVLKTNLITDVAFMRASASAASPLLHGVAVLSSSCADLIYTCTVR